jgi:DNA polymerase-4
MAPHAPRWILHVDMDAFFAAVEILDRPELAGKPVIVGGTAEGHGVVSTASYEARKFGVHSAMPAAQAVRLCPHGIFLAPRHERYTAASRCVFEAFREVTPRVEPLSIDEAFLDVTGSLPSAAKLRDVTESSGEVLALATAIQERVREATGGLTCSVGVAENKFLAKIASDLKKPAGQVLVPRGEAPSFLAPLPVRKLWGVGPRTEERLKQFGLVRVADIQQRSAGELEALLGVEAGRHLYRLVRGLDDREVATSHETKSVSKERTFSTFIPFEATEPLRAQIFSLANGVAERLRAKQLWGRTVTLKVRDHEFRTLTRSRAIATPTQLVSELFPVAFTLLTECKGLAGRHVRLLGVAATNLTQEPVQQLDFFDSAVEGRKRAGQVADVIDRVRQRAGDGAITRGSLLRRRPQ